MAGCDDVVLCRFEDVNNFIVISSSGEVTRSNPGNASSPQINSLPTSFTERNLPLTAYPLPSETIETYEHGRRLALMVDWSSVISSLGTLDDLPNETCNSFNGLRRKLKEQIKAIHQNPRTLGMSNDGSGGVAYVGNRGVNNGVLDDEWVRGGFLAGGSVTGEGMAGGGRYGDTMFTEPIEGVAGGGVAGRGVAGGGRYGDTMFTEPIEGVAGGGVAGRGVAGGGRYGDTMFTEPIEGVAGGGVAGRGVAGGGRYGDTMFTEPIEGVAGGGVAGRGVAGGGGWLGEARLWRQMAVDAPIEAC